MSDVMHQTAQDILEQKREEISRDHADYKRAGGKAKDIISILCELLSLHSWGLILLSLQYAPMNKQRLRSPNC